MVIQDFVNVPIWQLTVGQWLMVQAEANRQSETATSNTDKEQSQGRNYVYGLRGIEELFNVSHVTAQRLKDGILKPAVRQYGRKIIVDADMAMKLFERR
jgi:hypothetical protein